MINTSEGITGKEYSIVVNCYNNYHNEQIIPIISSTETTYPSLNLWIYLPYNYGGGIFTVEGLFEKWTQPKYNNRTYSN